MRVLVVTDWYFLRQIILQGHCPWAWISAKGSMTVLVMARMGGRDWVGWSPSAHHPWSSNKSFQQLLVSQIVSINVMTRNCLTLSLAWRIDWFLENLSIKRQAQYLRVRMSMALTWQVGLKGFPTCWEATKMTGLCLKDVLKWEQLRVRFCFLASVSSEVLLTAVHLVSEYKVLCLNISVFSLFDHIVSCTLST